MAKYFLSFHLHNLRVRGLVVILGVSLLVPLISFAANVQFTQDTQLDLSGLSQTLYAKSGSECNLLTVSGSTLTVAGIPSAGNFTLKTASQDILSLTPSGGSADLTFDTNYFSSGCISQWTVSSTVASCQVTFSVKVAEASADYLVKVNGANLNYYTSDNSGVVSFTYSGGFSSKIFTITREDRPAAIVSGGGGDTIPPSIADINVSVSSTGAVVTWQTSEASLTWLLYGTSTDYGSENKGTSYLTSHSVNLVGLAPETTYHYQVKSEDSAGNVGVYTDKTFTTLAQGQVPTEAAAPEEKVPTEEVTLPKITFEKPISEMTAAEIKAKIDEITAAIKTLQALLAQAEAKSAIEGIPAGFTFEKNLKFNDVSTDVKYLQIVLNSDTRTRLAVSGVGSPGHETNYFGPLTKKAVIKFQDKYASEILAPWGLTEGTGFVGKTTRAKLNHILGR